MKVRYRILTSTTDEKEIERVASENARESELEVPRFLRGPRPDEEASLLERLSARRHRGGGPSLGGIVVAAAEAPRQVLECDGEAELEEVKRMLLEGRMSSTDLVDIGQGWQTVDECYPLEEEAFVAAKRERRRRTGGNLLIALVTVVAIALAFALALAMSPE